MKKGLKVIVLALFAAAIGGFFYFDLANFLSLDYIKQQQSSFTEYYNQKPLMVIGIFLLIYITSTALSLPGATILTLIGGALFGLLYGTIIISFASTIGATLSFLAARFLLKDQIQNKFGEKLKPINEGIEKEGGFYLFTLRLIPVFPFFLINLLMGLTPIRTVQYFFISQLGMLPGTIVYVNAGTELAKIDSLKGILSPSLMLSFALLGLFPIAAKKLIAVLKNKKDQNDQP